MGSLPAQTFTVGTKQSQLRSQVDDNYVCEAGWRKNAVSLLPVVLPVPTISTPGFYVAGSFEKSVLNYFRKPCSRCSVSAGNEGEPGPQIEIDCYHQSNPCYDGGELAPLQKASEGCGQGIENLEQKKEVKKGKKRRRDR